MKIMLTIFCLFLGWTSAHAQNDQTLNIQDTKILRESLNQASIALNRIAYVYWENRQLNSAIEYYEQSKMLVQKAGEEESLNMIRSNLGMIYTDLALYEQALENLECNLLYYQKRNDNVRTIDVSTNIAVVLNLAGKFQKAKLQLTEALLLAVDQKDKKRIHNIYGLLSETCMKLGDQQGALYYLQLYKNSFKEQNG